jgi:hypothetical protein
LTQKEKWNLESSVKKNGHGYYPVVEPEMYNMQISLRLQIIIIAEKTRGYLLEVLIN